MDMQTKIIFISRDSHSMKPISLTNELQNSLMRLNLFSLNHFQKSSIILLKPSQMIFLIYLEHLIKTYLTVMHLMKHFKCTHLTHLMKILKHHLLHHPSFENLPESKGLLSTCKTFTAIKPHKFIQTNLLSRQGSWTLQVRLSPFLKLFLIINCHLSSKHSLLPFAHTLSLTLIIK